MTRVCLIFMLALGLVTIFDHRFIWGFVGALVAWTLCVVVTILRQP